MPAPSDPPVAFACEISEKRDKAAIVAVSRNAVGKLLVDLAPFYDHPKRAVERLEYLWGRHDPVDIVIDPRSQAATLLRPLADLGIPVTEPSTADVVIAHGEFLDLVNNGEMAHLGQPPLTNAVRAGQQRPLAGAQAWERRLGVDQSPLVAATLACWGFRRWEELSQPSAWVL